MRLLLIEDSPGDARLIRELVRDAAPDWDLVWRETLDEGIADARRGGFGVVLLDLSLPDSNGIETFCRMHREVADLPIVVLTGLEDERLAAFALRQGAQDYLPKNEMTGALLKRVARYAIERFQSKNALEYVYRDTRKSHDDLLAIMDLLALGVVTLDGEGRVTFMNRSARRFTGFDDAEVFPKPCADVLRPRGADADAVAELLRMSEGERSRISISLGTEDGEGFWIDLEARDDPRNPDGAILLLYDRSEEYRLRRALDEKVDFPEIVARSEAMSRIGRRIREIAPLDWTVLIEGETGTGKELVARAIHNAGPRAAGPFIAVNCAGLPDALLASLLFGHRRGSFTGAVDDRRGFFAAAEGGTILLDEIGDISPSMQSSLLRVLETREYTRVGDTQPERSDARVLTATHRDLAAEVEAGRFRADLLYRIRVMRIQIPPLRERREDIPMLIRHFLGMSRTALGKSVASFDAPSMRALLEYPWPGNVRELRSAIEYATVHCSGGLITFADLPPEFSRHRTRPDDADRGGERERYLDAIRKAGGNRSLAAKSLGIGRATFYRHLSRLGISETA
ncbi:MAG: sigma 54-interacting transcriptional regulator [Deltaproteobacteria bacterium]|nr:sigma 54-interacting transcriptional regulator [Deltaproteobacteria bacterium]